MEQLSLDRATNIKKTVIRRSLFIIQKLLSLVRRFPHSLAGEQDPFHKGIRGTILAWLNWDVLLCLSGLCGLFLSPTHRCVLITLAVLCEGLVVMLALRHLGQALLYCLRWMEVSGLLRPEFKLAHVTDHSLLYCAGVHELVACGIISPRECTCKDHSFSLLHQADSSSLVKIRCLTIWYTSPLNVSLLLNNSEV